jgi:spindle assembly abnormal protein 6
LGEKEVPIRVCLFNREEYMTRIVLSLTQQPGGHSTMNLQVTCENDPIFLWLLDMSEADFHKMKAEQNILID